MLFFLVIRYQPYRDKMRKSNKKILAETSWEDFMKYLVGNKNHSANPSAISAEKSRFQIIVKWFENKKWTAENFEALLWSYREAGRSQGTLNKLISMGKLLGEYLNDDVAKHLKCKVEKLKRIEDVVRSEEIKALANLYVNYSTDVDFINLRQKALILFMSTTGARIGEATKLKWQNLKHEPEKKFELLDTKNGTDRWAYLSDEVFDLINKLPRRSDYIFCSIHGKPLRSQEINKDLKRRASQLNIKKEIHTHVLRHSYATEMLECGVSETDVCVLGGWKDPKMLLRYKNSDHDYYSMTAKYHPLVRHELNWEKQAETCTRLVKKFFYLLGPAISTEVTQDEFVVKVKRNAGF